MTREVLERARRLARTHDDATPIDDLAAGMSVAEVAARRGLPEARVRGIQTFYDLLPSGPRDPAAPPRAHVCTGTACWSARQRAGIATPEGDEVRCLGRCYEAPAETGAAIDRLPHPIPVRSLTDPPVVFRHMFGDLPELHALYAAVNPELVMVRLEASGLRGRGGAAYPTAAKWRAARDAPGARKFVVANGDEGDPGSFVDRLLLERTPHVVLAGMNLCARVIGATEGIVFVRGEYPEAARAARAAIDEAKLLGLFAPGFEVSVRVGAGSYVCGEETALIKAIEGQRAESQVKPPYPAQRGLFGCPTIVQNVETLSIVPWVVTTGEPPRSKAFSVSGAVSRPGAIEAPFGTTLAELLAEAGRPIGVRWTMALVGGPMGTVVPAADFDKPLDYMTMPGLGHGGVVVLDERTSPRALAEHLFAFAAAESCGSCAPCRLGTRALASRPDRASLERLLDTLATGSLCGFGQGVPRPIRDLLRAFPGEVVPESPTHEVLRRPSPSAESAPPDGALVDGLLVPVPAGATVLDVCRAAGAEVPTLCHDDRVASGGHCRLCLVEVEGRMVASCRTPARAGTRIHTRDERIVAYRRDLLELEASEARLAGRAAELAQAHDVTGQRYPARPASGEVDASHPYLRFDASACVRCRLCERACDAIQGQFVWAFAGRGAGTRLIATGDEGPLAASACVSCGACASVCPTEAITDRDRQRAAAVGVERVVRTTCGYCGVGCQLEVHVGKDDRVARVDGAPDAAVNRGHLCVKGRYAHAFSRHPERLTTPLARKGGRLVPVSWEEALDRVAHGFAAIRARGGEVAGLSSSRCTNEENYLLQKWMRAGLGTNNVDCCARVCHGPSAAGMRRVLGTGAATNALADVELADCFLVAGANATAAHPVTGARIRRRVLAGQARLVVVDPRATELAALADVHLRLRPGTNVLLLNALAHALVALELVDQEFIRTRVDGLESYAAFLEAYSPEATAEATGVPPERVWEAARIYGTARRPMQVHGLGMTEHYQGSEGVMLLCNLALLVGAVGREGVGVNPLRGQNNVQGAADMGCQPDLLTGYQRPDDLATRARFEHVWGRPVPTEPGLTLPRMYEAARAGRLQGMFILGEDVVQTDPASHVDEALDRLELLVVQELFLTDTARRAHVVLPGASFLEKDGTFTNGERRVQRVRRALDPPGAKLPHGGARADWRILVALMARAGLSQRFASPADVLDEIAHVAPSLTGVAAHRLEGDGLQWPVPTPKHAGTPRLHVGTFAAMPGGRARFAEVGWLPTPSLEHAGAFPLRLVTGRVLEHYNCGSMTRRTDNIALAPDDPLEVHPDDLAALGVDDGATVVVESPWGAVEARAKATERVAPGTVFLSFHFPETRTNALVSPVLDRLADCPEYKVTPVRLRAVAGPSPQG
ncbi:MAG: formate dehydrogenase subunit alpha [Deltaproteobacteria bacterium]|nr:formate dehydrogenase subunit alpha [Deltaproteobacteria bacterium]